MKPIIFNGEMVRAILEGRKTQTRRVIKPQPQDHHWDSMSGYKEKWTGLETSSGFQYRLDRSIPQGSEAPEWFKSPYGGPGDQLWVRETFAIKNCGRSVSLNKEAWPDGALSIERVQYPATDKAPHKDYWWNKRPSIFMPRWASRITLEITNIKVERVQDIPDGDVQKEGVDEGWIHLWDSINAKRGFGWDVNPWIWVVEFKLLESK